jgi:hypothetical protein
MKIYKKIIRNSFIFTLLILIVVASINFIIDPYKQYGLNRLNPYFLNSRYLNPGLIKSYSYDTIIAGSSYSENFLINEIDKALGLKSLKVTSSGATAFENKSVMSLALKKEKVKTIILELNPSSFRGDKKRVNNIIKTLPSYLYDDNVFNDYRYLLNFDVLYSENLRAIASNFFGFNEIISNIDFAYYWADGVSFSEENLFNDLENLKVYKSQIDSKKVSNNSKLQLSKQSFDFNVLQLIKDYPNTKFIIFHPPFSIVAFKWLDARNQLDDSLDFKRYIFESTKKYNNVSLYDFQIEKNITHNLDNYLDTHHYSNLVNRWMINQIKKETYLVNQDTFDKYLNSLKTQIQEYNIIDYN